jgi:hypothetical protein
MRSWESMRQPPPGRRWGFPRSHGPAEGKNYAVRVSLCLVSQRARSARWTAHGTRSAVGGAPREPHEFPPDTAGMSPRHRARSPMAAQRDTPRSETGLRVRGAGVRWRRPAGAAPEIRPLDGARHKICRRRRAAGAARIPARYRWHVGARSGAQPHGGSEGHPPLGDRPQGPRRRREVAASSRRSAQDPPVGRRTAQDLPSGARRGNRANSRQISLACRRAIGRAATWRLRGSRPAARRPASGPAAPA